MSNSKVNDKVNTYLMKMKLSVLIRETEISRIFNCTDTIAILNCKGKAYKKWLRKFQQI